MKVKYGFVVIFNLHNATNCNDISMLIHSNSVFVWHKVCARGVCLHFLYSLSVSYSQCVQHVYLRCICQTTDHPLRWCGQTTFTQFSLDRKKIQKTEMETTAQMIEYHNRYASFVQRKIEHKFSLTSQAEAFDTVNQSNDHKKPCKIQVNRVAFNSRVTQMHS